MSIVSLAEFRPPAAEASLAPETVLAAVMDYTRLGRSQLLTPNGRYPEVAWPKHELTWLLREMTGMSIAAIARFMGGRDGKTVLHSIKRVTQRAATDAEYQICFDRLRGFVAAYAAREPTGAAAGEPKPDSAVLVFLMLRAILTCPDLSDAEARIAARSIVEAHHG